ncbi:Do family serine endopeptidase [Marinicella sp. S1101]|uniref:Do family serine endopeptidase n=1 Tax=Marinicella marina TaxID=2996016 RepID=UPI002260B750|nr:Do family serine endopeptidase [Marinicella marina]MCX7554359.1 Do family serine endopeptidase [Marinicella marina]MDJ1138650.1 Do family serine endopeptidase [Marinicella marina]
MKKFKSIFVICCGLMVFATSQASLPAAVNGQPVPSLAPILEQVTPAVVNINTQSIQYVRSRNSEFYSWFYGLPNTPRERVTQSLGSGVIVDAVKGLILTNHHVVGDADDISVVLHDGRTYNGRLIGSDEGTDVAVIQIEADDLTALPLADSEQLRVGDFVVAVGNPFGLGQTVTSGIVSALGRTSLSGLGYQNFIQTDASINPGNSGGALIDLNGALVGINTAIFSPSGGNVGIGFAIPSSLAKRMMRQLVEFGTVRRGSLGMGVQDITERLARAFDVGQKQGVLVTSVDPDSPADRAGIQAGDIITRLNGDKISNQKQFQNYEGLIELDSQVKIDYLRDDAAKQVMTLITEADRNELKGQELHPLLKGTLLSNLPLQYRDRFQGVLIEEIERGSSAWELGLRAGDLVTSVNKREINSLKQMTQNIDASKKTPLLNIYRNGRNYLLLLEGD